MAATNKHKGAPIQLCNQQLNTRQHSTYKDLLKLRRTNLFDSYNTACVTQRGTQPRGMGRNDHQISEKSTQRLHSLQQCSNLQTKGRHGLLPVAAGSGNNDQKCAPAEYCATGCKSDFLPVYFASIFARNVLPSSRLLSASPLSCVPGDSSQVSQSYMSRRLQACPPRGHWGYLSTASCF